MSVEKNKETVRRYADAFNRGAFDEIVRVCTEDVQIYGVLGAGGLDVALPIWKALHEGLALNLQVEDLAGDGHIVAARFTETGTFRGMFMGKQPTGKSYTVSAMEWFHFTDGKISRRWGARDSAAIMRQIGLATD